MRRWALVAFMLLAGRTVAVAAGPASGDSLLATLRQAEATGRWVEAVTLAGARRTMQVESLSGDSVFVRERLGPLYGRPAVYALADLQAVVPGAAPTPIHRPAGRIRPATALGLELVVPGAGYVYVGDTGTALSLAGIATLAAGTAVMTGRDGAAGWVPAVAWLKVASLLHLRDEVRARNGTLSGGEPGRGTDPTVRPGSYLRDVSLSVPACRGRSLYGLELRVGF